MSLDHPSTDSDEPSHWGLIDRIYETGQSPKAWPLLVDSLFNSFRFDENIDSGSAALGTSLHELWPHFERALSLNTYIDGIADNTTASPFADVPYPFVVVNNTFDVVYRNAESVNLFPPQSGVEVGVQKISITNADISRKLTTLVAGIPATEPARSITPIYRDEQSNNHLVAISLPRMTGGNLLALGWFDPIDQGLLTAEHFRQLYQLTDAESKVLNQVLRGQETDQVAKSLVIGSATVRTHLKSIYRKTATTGKTDLIQTVRCGPALLSRFLAPRTEMYADTKEARNRRNQILELHDGREMGFAEFGAPNGRPVLLVHNLIGSRLQLPTSEDNLVAQNLRLIVPDRPGVGLSGFHSHRSFHYWTNDIGELADHLRIQKFHLIGSSMGAIYGLALAQGLPDRIERYAMVSCLPEIADVKAARKLLPSTCRLFLLARYAPAVLEIILKFIVRKGPEAYLDELVCDLPALDQRLYEDPAFNRMMVRAVSETLRQGTASIFNDIRIMASPWQLSPESISIPVHFWHGEDDTMAPLPMIREFAAKIPDCKQRLVERESHWLLFRQWNAIIAELLR